MAVETFSAVIGKNAVFSHIFDMAVETFSAVIGKNVFL